MTQKQKMKLSVYKMTVDVGTVDEPRINIFKKVTEYFEDRKRNGEYTVGDRKVVGTTCNKYSELSGGARCAEGFVWLGSTNKSKGKFRRDGNTNYLDVDEPYSEDPKYYLLIEGEKQDKTEEDYIILVLGKIGSDTLHREFNEDLQRYLSNNNPQYLPYRIHLDPWNIEEYEEIKKKGVESVIMKTDKHFLGADIEGTSFKINMIDEKEGARNQLYSRMLNTLGFGKDSENVDKNIKNKIEELFDFELNVNKVAVKTEEGKMITVNGEGCHIEKDISVHVGEDKIPSPAVISGKVREVLMEDGKELHTYTPVIGEGLPVERDIIE